MDQPIWNFEQEPWVDERPDETSYNLRAHFDRIPDEKMRGIFTRLDRRTGARVGRRFQ